MSLEILGNDHDGLSLWFRTERGETDATPADLATARQRAAKYGHAYINGVAVDESDVTELIHQMDRPQFLYPPEPCKWCDDGAVVCIEGDFMCHNHSAAYAAREDEGMAS